MERQRSPSYPSLSLPQAIDMAEKLHKANRTSVISRETAAKDMGYAGLTGRSLTVLAALAQFGLVERAGKGDIKVSRRAVDILHSVDEADKAEAIQEAAFAPALFKQLHERFPEGVPSQNALRSYLIQRDFGDVAIGPAIASFLETNAFVENAKETGRTGDSAEGLADSVHRDEPEIIMHPQPTAMPLNPVPVPPFATLPEPSLNKVTMNIEGDRVLVSGLFDLRGLKALKRKIEGLEALLAPDEEFADSADSSNDYDL